MLRYRSLDARLLNSANSDFYSDVQMYLYNNMYTARMPMYCVLSREMKDHRRSLQRALTCAIVKPSYPFQTFGHKWSALKQTMHQVRDAMRVKGYETSR